MGGHVKIYPDTTNVYSIAFLSAKTGTLEAMSIFRSNTQGEKKCVSNPSIQEKIECILYILLCNRVVKRLL